MKPLQRQGLSAMGLLAIIGLLLGGAASTALTLWDARANLAALREEDQALKARARKLKPREEENGRTSPFLYAATITLAGAMLEQRVESAIAAAGGNLASSQVDVGGRADARRIGLQAELTIAQPDMQKLLFDLETGRPDLFIDSFEAHAPEATKGGGAMRVSLVLSARWGGAK